MHLGAMLRAAARGGACATRPLGAHARWLGSGPRARIAHRHAHGTRRCVSCPSRVRATQCAGPSGAVGPRHHARDHTTAPTMCVLLALLAGMGTSHSSASPESYDSEDPPCHPSAHTPNLEWSGPSMAHGLVGDGSDEACEAWCCATDGCSAWSNLIDKDCHLQPEQRCCMGWPAGRNLTVVHDASSHCTSGRIDGKPVPEPWPINPGDTWQPTWDMAMSTIMMPCNTSGWFDSVLAAKYGVVDFDWSNARQLWANAAPMDDGARLITQAAMVKAVNPNSHVWIYRNLVKALSWYKGVGEKLADPAYSGWFLHFRDGVASSNYSSNPCTIQGVPSASAGKPSIVQEPNTNCLPGSGCAILHNKSTLCPNHGATETAAVCSDVCEADEDCVAFTWHAPESPNPPSWQKQCFLIKRGVALKCFPEKLHDSGVKGYGSVCSPLYHSQDQTPEHLTGRKECVKDCYCGGNGRQIPCGEYIWDHRNASLREWLVKEHVMGTSSGGMDGMANPNVTGFYFDDYWSESGEGWSHGPQGLPQPARPNLTDCKTGPSEIQIDCLKDMGLSEKEVLDLNAGWRETTANAMRAVAKAGGFVWQMFAGLSTPPDKGAECVSGYHAACAKLRTDMNHMSLRLKDSHAPGSVLDAATDVARFLLIRGSYSYLGTGWVGCEPDSGVEGGGHNQTYARPKEFDVDYGEPLGLCKEDSSKPGRFVRHYTKATASHDCSTGVSTVTLH